jgi:hypothetical protein
MTRNDIIRMAKEVGIDVENDTLCRFEGWVEPMEKFAQLVAAAEREACAKVCDDLPVPPYVSDNDAHIWDVTCVDCAEAIRARGSNVHN